MGETETLEVKKRKKYHRKTERRIKKWKKAGHQIFSSLLVLLVFPALYFIVWGLIIEPQFPRHFYGPGDFKELILLAIISSIMLISYWMILLINYKPLNMSWWDNFRLLMSVNFNLEKYSALKHMGINYHHQKKKADSKKRKSTSHYPKP